MVVALEVATKLLFTVSTVDSLERSPVVRVRSVCPPGPLWSVSEYGGTYGWQWWTEVHGDGGHLQ